MQREQFHQLLTRAADICSGRELVVLGSQSVHALTVSPPVEVLVSVECALCLRAAPDLAARLTAEMGKNSVFAQTTGVYADVLAPELPLLPRGWEQRLLAYSVGEVTVRCLDVHDLIVSKLAAGRLKDYEFIAAVLLSKLAHAPEVVRRIQTFPDPHTQAVLLARLRIAAESVDMGAYEEDQHRRRPTRHDDLDRCRSFDAGICALAPSSSCAASLATSCWLARSSPAAPIRLPGWRGFASVGRGPMPAALSPQVFHQRRWTWIRV